MFSNIGADAAKTLADALPSVEGTVRDTGQMLSTLVSQQLLPCLAEVVSQAITQVDRLDGAAVEVEADGRLTATVTVSVNFPKFTARVSAPLKLDPKEGQVT